MQRPRYKIFFCDVLNPLSEKKCEFFRDGIIVLKRGENKNYHIVEIGEKKNIFPRYYRKRSAQVFDYQGLLAIPPFFDMHFHWVQDDVCLMPKESLLTWLSKYTWPSEAKFESDRYARIKACEFAEKLLSVGTLGGACYSSIHPHATSYAFSSFKGDFIVGNVLMDMNSPECLLQTRDDALRFARKMSCEFKGMYAVTPRFAFSTTPETMTACSRIAREKRCYIQTHLCESKEEIKEVLAIYRKIEGFEDVKTYTEIYHRCGILGPKTIMGHAIHMEASELKLLRKMNTVIAHCPTSNAPIEQLGLGSGLFNYRRIDKLKIRWVLGSDIGGGPYLSMFDVMRSFVEQNRNTQGISYTNALFRSTLAGASILKVDYLKGNFMAGKKANFILVKSSERKDNGKKKESAETVLADIIEAKSSCREEYDKMVLHTFIDGMKVYSR